MNDENKLEEKMIKTEVEEGSTEVKQMNDESKVQKPKKGTQIIKKTIANEKRPTNSIRYDQYNHFPLISKESVRCKNEGCSKKNNVYCKKCKVHLCLMNRRNCFTDFHLLNSNNEGMSEHTEEHTKSTEVRPKNSIRFDECSHFPLITATQVRCKNCNQKTYILCQKCKVHLCIVRNRNCFTDFHVLSLEEIKIE